MIDLDLTDEHSAPLLQNRRIRKVDLVIGVIRPAFVLVAVRENHSLMAQLLEWLLGVNEPQVVQKLVPEAGI